MSDKDCAPALYKIGITNDNYIELTVGHPTSISLNMTATGTRNLIALLQAAVNTLEDNNEPAL